MNKELEKLKEQIAFKIKWNGVLSDMYNITKDHLLRIRSWKVNLSKKIKKDINLESHTKIIKSDNYRVTIIIEEL